MHVKFCIVDAGLRNINKFIIKAAKIEENFKNYDQSRGWDACRINFFNCCILNAAV